MSKTAEFSIAALFLDGKPPVDPLEFTWILIRRRHRPFLLVPVTQMGVRASLQLYSPQRPCAKIWRGVLPVVLRTPLAGLFPRITLRVDKNTEIIRFLSEQSGVPVDQLSAPAIKFGGLENQKSRLVLLAADGTRRPVKVIKVGLDTRGRVATDVEADLLAKLPADKLGCIRSTGRLKTEKFSAFATSFFPGESPDDDGGMQILFHSWINPGPAVAMETLGAWQDLETQVAHAVPGAWAVLRERLVGTRVRSTLHHGDFAPWNIRAVNSQNLQAFDWEGGALFGVPGWDWFHFVVQTSILARRHSTERVAAELEKLLQSRRFKEYAAATGITPIVQPLVLTYLLHHRWVVQPQDGANETMALFQLLASRWNLAGQPAREVPAGNRGGRLGTDAWRQLKSAWVQLTNVFWEPTLIADAGPPAGLRGAWSTILGCSLWIGAVASAQSLFANHLLLLPIYAIPCLIATWKISRRWGYVFASAVAAVGPLVAAAREPEFFPTWLICWNMLMRFILLQTCVFLVDQIRGQRHFFQRLLAPKERAPHLAGNWVVVLASGLWFVLVAIADIYTGPRVIVLPLYLIPAMLITLCLNLRWGIIMALTSAILASAEEYTSKYNANLLEIFGWNFSMRFLTLYVIILLLDRFRDGNVLFNARPEAVAPRAMEQA